MTLSDTTARVPSAADLADSAAARADRLAATVAACAAGELVSFQQYGKAPAWLARAAAAAAAAQG